MGFTVHTQIVVIDLTSNWFEKNYFSMVRKRIKFVNLKLNFLYCVLRQILIWYVSILISKFIITYQSAHQPKSRLVKNYIQTTFWILFCIKPTKQVLMSVNINQCYVKHHKVNEKCKSQQWKQYNLLKTSWKNSQLHHCAAWHGGITMLVFHCV